MEIKNTSDEVKLDANILWSNKLQGDPRKESKQTPKGELSLTLNKAYKSPAKEEQRFEVENVEKML